MGNYAEWRAADVSTSGDSKGAGRDYYHRCDQSVNITVTVPISITIGRGMSRAAGWIMRWVSCTALLCGLYFAFGLHGRYLLPCGVIGGVALGNLVRYAEWRVSQGRNRT